MFLFINVNLPCVIVDIVLFKLNSAIAVNSRGRALRIFGDYAQIINPLITSGLASQKKRLKAFCNHFREKLSFYV